MFRHPILRTIMFATAFCAAGAHAAPAAATDPAGIGFELRPQASGDELGLPVYPGAVQRKEPGESGSGLTLALWGGGEGFRLALQKYDTPDSMERVASFYRTALQAFGTVLDCSKTPLAADDAQALRCDEKGVAGTQVFKVGTRQNQRIVSLKTIDGRVAIDLVRLQTNR